MGSYAIAEGMLRKYYCAVVEAVPDSFCCAFTNVRAALAGVVDYSLPKVDTHGTHRFADLLPCLS
jgi:hypothetical protein